MKITTSEINVLSLLLTPPYYDQFAWCRRDLISIPFSMNIDWQCVGRLHHLYAIMNTRQAKQLYPIGETVIPHRRNSYTPQAKQLYPIGETSETSRQKLGDWFREHLPDVERNDNDTSNQKLAILISLIIATKHGILRFPVSLHHCNTENCKNREIKVHVYAKRQT